MTGYRYSTLGIAGGIAGVAAGYFLGAEFVEASRFLFNVGALEKVAFNHVGKHCGNHAIYGVVASRASKKRAPATNRTFQGAVAHRFFDPYLVPCVSALVGGASGVIVGEAGREIARRVYDFFRPMRESIPAVEFPDRKRSRE